MVPVQEAFGSAHALERAVRALCDADIAVFDITGQEAAVMLLLGIRAAARRGIHDPSQPLPGSDSHASLQHLVVEPGLRWRCGRRRYSWLALGRTFESGVSSYRRQPTSYLDLPVFDAVRELGEEYRLKQPNEQVLVLRWFDPHYGGAFREAIDSSLINTFGERTQVVTVLDSRSPQLVEQRLYSEIRRTQLCVVDWTGWRPNVFFELGVRLAVNPVDPVHIVSVAAPAEWTANNPGLAWPPRQDKTSDLLRAMFPVVAFDLTSDDGDQAVDERLSRFRQSSDAYYGGQLSPGAIYRIVAKSSDWHREVGGMPIDAMLALRARDLDGPSVPEDGASCPVLHSEVFASEARVSAIEHLLAAYYYLLNRFDLEAALNTKAISPEDVRVKSARRIAEEICNRMLRETDPDLRNIGTQVEAQLERLGGAGENVIETARNLKGRALEARDRLGNYPRAHELLEEAEQLLRKTLAKLNRMQKSAETDGSYEFEIHAQLAHICGSRGGVFRREGKLEEAVLAYGRGADEEATVRDSSRPNSYNLTQRLVLAAMIAPEAVLDAGTPAAGLRLKAEIESALREVKRQIATTRGNDVYAAGDLLMLSLLTEDAPIDHRWMRSSCSPAPTDTH